MYNSKGPTPDVLSRRELQVLKLVSEGLTSHAIAHKLGVSKKTVAFHKTRIAKKVGGRGTVMLVRWAIRNGVIDP
jgi:DNA-binding CsgD family transcriptional regulator